MKAETENSKNSYNKVGFYLFMGTVVFSSLWAAYFLVMKNKIDLGEYATQVTAQPTETALEDKEKSTELSSKDKEQAWLSSESLIAYGSKIYQAQCAVCHGAKGLGDGTPGLIPPPRNLVEGEWKQGGSSKELFVTLLNGVEGTSMVSFKHLSKLDRWALVHYIRSITNNKVTDDEAELEAFAKQAL